jgi:choline dehydrogenase-like flavoprotein
MARTERADIAIVGSGPGGAAVACLAARAGRSTLVLERGPYVTSQDLRDDELRAIPRLYKDGGLFLNAEMDMFILQGSCVGGSSQLANMVMMRPDASAMAAWRTLGADVPRDDFGAALDQIERELEVSRPNARNVSPSNRAFYDSAWQLGLQADWMNKALGACDGCGYCNVHCSIDEKRSALSTYIRSAEQAGARVLADAEVTAIGQRRGKATHLEVECGRARERIRVEARVFVLAAGAIGSSALLLRSGLGRHVGTRLSFNAGSMVIGEFPHPVDGWDGDQMTVYLKEPGYVIEATHNPPMSMALTTPGWLAEHSALMRRSRKLAYAGVLVATQPVGRVVQSRAFGHEEVRFELPHADLVTLRRGLRRAAEIWFNAGATRVILPSHKLHAIERREDLDQIDAIMDKPSRFSFGSAHPQGGNPWSDDPDLGAVDGNLALHGCENLFVCDASVFPSSIGVNPIETILAVAKHGASQAIARA